MSFTKACFEILTVFMTLMVAVVLFIMIGTPNLPTLLAVIQYGWLPVVAMGIGSVSLARWCKLTKAEWSGYWRASLVLVGGTFVILFAPLTLFGLLQGSVNVYNLIVCSVGLLMLGVSWLGRRNSASCLPQLRSLLAFFPDVK